MLIHAVLAMLLWRQHSPVRIATGHSIQFVDLGGFGVPVGGGAIQKDKGSSIQTNKPVEKNIVKKSKAAAVHSPQPRPQVKAVITDKPATDISPTKQPKAVEKITAKQTHRQVAKETSAESVVTARQEANTVSSAIVEGSAVVGNKSGSGKSTDGEGHGMGNGSKAGSGEGMGAGSSAANPLKAKGSIPTPPYPDLARENGEYGTVVLSVLVAPDGKVSDVKVVKSSRSRILDNAARRAAQKGSFQPRGWTLYTIPISFKLD
ncbi:energy transducer TonB [Neisseria sp. S1]|uniref:energy transducer TonB n=1 Tax=Neisseria sp. S1 TaxID=3318354 RepID=UPI003A87F7BB